MLDTPSVIGSLCSLKEAEFAYMFPPILLPTAGYFYWRSVLYKDFKKQSILNYEQNSENQ